MLFVDLWQSPILGFTHYETCLPRKEDQITTFEYRNAFYDLINTNNFTKNNKKEILDNIFNESKSALEIVNNSFNMEFVGQKIITMAN